MKKLACQFTIILTIISGLAYSLPVISSPLTEGALPAVQGSAFLDELAQAAASLNIHSPSLPIPANVSGPVDKDSVGKLAKLIRDNLTRDDVISDDLIDIIDVTDDGQLRFDLSLHPEAAKIEKLLLSLANKRIIKQKVKGEPLVQVSSALYDGLFELDFSKSKLERNAAIKKYMGSNFLPTYHRGADGKTTAMKVAIALQGDYEYLLNLDYQGEPIGNIDRLNEAIKDDEWLDANNGANRKAITLVGVRIPVQGLNSMEFGDRFTCYSDGDLCSYRDGFSCTPGDRRCARV